MKLKDFDWSQVKIGDFMDTNPFGKNNNMTTLNEYNDFLIKDYIESEKKYSASFDKVFKSAKTDYAFKRDEELVWVCSHCGYVHNHPEAPKQCPICGSARAYFGIQY